MMIHLRAKIKGDQEKKRANAGPKTCIKHIKYIVAPSCGEVLFETLYVELHLLVVCPTVKNICFMNVEFLMTEKRTCSTGFFCYEHWRVKKIKL